MALLTICSAVSSAGLASAGLVSAGFVSAGLVSVGFSAAGSCAKAPMFMAISQAATVFAFIFSPPFFSF
ncbi:MAG: hypothetical protein JXR40_10185 [Pontiellaceae bacterium]|nr:hypothetical protein [Pontiellaceae bacterium]